VPDLLIIYSKPEIAGTALAGAAGLYGLAASRGLSAPS